MLLATRSTHFAIKAQVSCNCSFTFRETSCLKQLFFQFARRGTVVATLGSPLSVIQLNFTR